MTGDYAKSSPSVACLACGENLDAHENINGGAAVPQPGDVSLCWLCGSVAMYADGGQLRAPSEAELASILEDREVRRAIAACRDSYSPTQAVDKLRGLDRLPCGCRIGTVEDAFVMEPCSPNCPYFQYTVDEARRQGKPIRAVADPEMSAAEFAAYGMGEVR